MYQNRIILMRFYFLLMWFQSCCTQIVPIYIKTNIYIYLYIYNKLLNKDKSEGSEKN